MDFDVPHDRLFVSTDEVALQWALFDKALARDATRPVARGATGAVALARDATGPVIAPTDGVRALTDPLIGYVVGSDVESVLRGSGVRLDGLLDAEEEVDTVSRGLDATAIAAGALELRANQSGG